jgi:xanthosine utilization system XapX-like protein
MNNSKFGNVLGTAGVLSGIFFAMKNNKSIGATAFYALGFGIAGILIGNSITKFYE